ncbi:uncharacterized protein LOC119077404 [Bradysia coprophila]|uniref:uncharacterized protein LOC119077404 n=1 Tax=Bradysia coprophila TaxID=38358 RepID=UPI00187D8312|nr:uncharacterized protein LOC119077404 [Bradysia coprophila]
MTEIAEKIESIRNMKTDLNSIKLMSQKRADKMLQHLADFRSRICNEMSQIESTYQIGRNCKQKEKRKSDRKENATLRSDYNESEDYTQMSEILSKWENYSLMGTDLSANVSSVHDGSNVSQNNEKISSSVDTLDSTSTTDKVNILFSKQLPHTTPDSLPTAIEVKSDTSPTPSHQVKRELEILQDETNPLSKDKIDKLTKKLKEIQTQNKELQNVNENIQNLLLKLGDLKYADAADAETADKLDTVKKESQMSSDDSCQISEIIPETIMKTESSQQFTRSFKITNTTRNNMLTKINVAKLVINRLRSCGDIVDQEHKYKVRVRQAEQSITLKAHYNKPQ